MSVPDLHHATLNGYAYVVEVKREPFYWLATTAVFPGVEFRGDSREEVIYKVETEARGRGVLAEYQRRVALAAISPPEKFYRTEQLSLELTISQHLVPIVTEGVHRVRCTTCGGHFNHAHREPACPHELRE